MSFSNVVIGHRVRIRWWLVLFLSWALVVTFPIIRTTWDTVGPADWIAVDLSIKPGRAKPLIQYDKDVRRPFDGTWNARIYSAAWARIDSRKGDGDYTQNRTIKPDWRWDAFFANGREPVPPVPVEPFYICVSYRMTTLDTLVTRDSPSFCTDLYDPTQAALTQPAEDLQP